MSGPRRRADNSREAGGHLLAAIFDSARDAIVCADASGRIRLFNSAAEDMFGYRREEILGRNVSMLMPPHDREMHDEYMTRYRESGVSRIDHSGRELIAQRRDGSTLHVHLALSEVQVDGQLYYTSIIRDLSAHKAIENALAASEARYRTLFESAPEGLWLISPEGITLEVNRRLCDLLGYSREGMVGRAAASFLHHPNPLDPRSDFPTAGEDSHRAVEIELTHKQGHAIPCHLSTASLRERDGSLSATLAFVSDLTERKRVEAQIQQDRELLQTTIDSVSDPIVVIGTDYRILTMNRAARAGLPDRPAGNDEGCCHLVFEGRTEPCRAPDRLCPLRAVMEQQRPVTLTQPRRDNNGVRYLEIAASPLFNRDHNLDGVVTVTRDVTEQIQLMDDLSHQEARMERLAHHDPLTGLPNRLLLMQRLDQAVAAARRSGIGFALLFIDLDRFKQVNDEFGHDYGDEILCAAARRLATALRAHDTLARHGGDELVAILPEQTEQQGIESVAERLVKAMREPVQIGTRALRVTVSIGIARFPHNGRDASSLLQHADAAMYRAKQGGRDRYTPLS